ncbi:Glycerol-3-phosphate acyltransferase 1, mitochondrial [Bagarius yarrelli]|uniref:Glycerol-3-phosphate acyltransferase 1, mitochondrial n=1 Tax=Bagarius yarrelli TaxID=175774 RepID=A0A556TJ48_BAGYA|nr:Glycerol-3-phosphate acyltransferase 1, mitochondrial [Bagarius yarrelli]
MDVNMALGAQDSLLLASSPDQAVNRLKHPCEEQDRSCSPSVLHSVTSTWKDGLLNRKRPFVGRCCYSCTPQSQGRLFNSSIPSLGLRNVIYINETHTRHRGWLARRLSYVLFVLERDVRKDMFARNVSAIEHVASETRTDQKATSKVRQKARNFLQEMVANISPSLIRLTGWTLLKLFNGFFWSIQIHKGQLEMVKKAASEYNAPLVFLPVHKSHIDYLLITFILFCHNIKAPHIAAGNNLNIPIFSTLIRKLGGFFIRRKLDETADGKKDVLYRALLHAYTEELLQQKQFLEVYLEGTRSRSGKPSPARAGILSIVVDALCAGAIPDVLIVPIGISYDRIIEGNYNSEQLGKPKKNESLWGVACGVWRMLRKNNGCVRVDFTQPFSLKEYLNTQRSRNLPAPLTLEQILIPTIITAQPDEAVFNREEEEHQDSRELSDEPWRRQVISNLAKHILFTANKSSAIMSTHIVACLLLYRHRQGVLLSKLVEDFFNMKEEILSRDFDLGFSGNSEDVVMHALNLLGNCVNVTSTNRNTEFIIAPSNTVPALFELNFYSNGLFHVFIADAIIACSALAMLREQVTENEHAISSTLLSQERLICRAAGLSHFLSNEVIVALPCQTVYQVFHDAVTRLIQYGVLTVADVDQEELSPSEEPWPKKFPEPLSWRSDEEDEDSDFGEEQRDRYLKVSPSPEHQEFFTFLQRLLSPVLEAYSGAAIFVHSLLSPMTEREYTHRLFKYLLTRTEKRVAGYGNNHLFLDLEKKLITYFPKPQKQASLMDSLVLHLRVQYYVRNAQQFLDQKVCTLYCADLKNRVLSSQCYEQEGLYFQLAAYALQADLGDWNEGVETYFTPKDYFPPWILKRRGCDYVLQHTPKLHRELEGMSAHDASLLFIEEACSLSDVPVTFYSMSKGKKEEGVSVLLGLAFTGLRIYELKTESEEYQLLYEFAWSTIDSLTFQGRRFEISADALAGKVLVMYTESVTHSQHLLKHISNSHRVHLEAKHSFRQLQGGEKRQEKEVYIRNSIDDSNSEDSEDELPSLKPFLDKARQHHANVRDTAWGILNKGKIADLEELELCVDEPEEMSVDDPDEITCLIDLREGVSVDGPPLVTVSQWIDCTTEMKEVLRLRACSFSSDQCKESVENISASHSLNPLGENAETFNQRQEDVAF